MESIGFHSKIKLDGREFHIHTGSVTEKNVVLSEIFEKGKFVSSKNVDFFSRNEARNATEKYIKQVAEKLHKEMLDEIDTLFLVHTKIKSINQYLPHFRLSGAFYEKCFFDEAIESLNRVIELQTDYIPAYHRLGLCYIKSGNRKKAIEIFEKGIKLAPDFVDLINSLGVAHCLNQDYDKSAVYFQQAMKLNPDLDEANFNLGVVLFRSMLEDSEENEKIIVPSRLIRYIKSLKILDRYSSEEWQNTLNDTLEVIKNSDIDQVLNNLEKLQIKLATELKINTLLDIFFLKFMYGGRELTRDELDQYEEKILELKKDRRDFADYWNDIGVIHMIQCRSLFLSALNEFERAASFNEGYEDAKKNLGLVKNNKKGFLILLRAILK
ncbi:tetratricopeptide repeat protein [Calditrichota bacterium]